LPLSFAQLPRWACISMLLISAQFHGEGSYHIGVLACSLALGRLVPFQILWYGLDQNDLEQEETIVFEADEKMDASDVEMSFEHVEVEGEDRPLFDIIEMETSEEI
jgi:hypothetical protein